MAKEFPWFVSVTETSPYVYWLFYADNDILIHLSYLRHTGRCVCVCVCVCCVCVCVVYVCVWLCMYIMHVWVCVHVCVCELMPAINISWAHTIPYNNAGTSWDTNGISNKGALLKLFIEMGWWHHQLGGMHNMWAYRHQLRILLVDNFNCVKIPAFMDRWSCQFRELSCHQLTVLRLWLGMKGLGSQGCGKEGEKGGERGKVGTGNL